MVAVELVLNLNLISLDVNSVTLFSNSSSKLVSTRRLLLGSSKVMFEEAGELSKAILKNDQDEFVDAIGDMIVVLTNLAEQRNVKVETCIASAYNQIANRTGTMINGTFVKDE